MTAPARAPVIRAVPRPGRSAAARPSRPPRQPRPSRPPARRSLRIVPARPVTAPRTPFVLLVLALLGAGLVALLLLNAAAVANSDQQRRLRQQTDALRIREQQLRREVSSLEAPGALAERARRLGMVPSGDPAFLILLPGGGYRIAGDPDPAPVPTAAPTPSPIRSSGPSGRPGGPAASGSPTPGTPGPSRPAEHTGGGR